MGYLIQKHQAYYVRVRVPVALRPIIGKREYTVPLKTTVKSEALDRSHAVVARIKAELRSAKKAEQGALLDIARVAAPRIDYAEDGTPNGAALDFEANLDARVDALESRYGSPEKVPEADSLIIHTASRIASGKHLTLLSEQVEAYLSEQRGTIREQTYRDKELVYSRLQTHLRVNREVASITRAEAGAYVSTVLAMRDQAAKTKKHELAHLSALWRWMQGRGVVDANVWSLMSKTIATTKRGGVNTERRPWSPEELSRFFRETDQGDPLWSTAALSLYSGCRVEELCAMKAEHVRDGALNVVAAKSNAGVRAVPVHPVIEPLVSSLLGHGDEYLIPGLLVSGRDAKRSVLFAKRSSYHLRKVLKITDPDVVFHGLRHNFINTLEELGVPESTVKLIVGHSRRGSITYGAKGKSYSRGLSFERLRAEVVKLTHGNALDALVKATGGAVRITYQSARRHRRGREAA